MNAVEIEEAVSLLAEQPFDAAEFPFEFLAAFGNKETTLKRLRAEGRGGTNQSDIPGGVLQRGNIHLKTCEPGQVAETLKALRESKKTATHKAKFILATDGVFALYNSPLWNMALIASRLHWVWIGTVCVRLEMRFSYSNTLGWNTFPVPKLTEKNRADLTAAAEGILLAREAHFPATIADLYDPEKMPANLRAAHDHNDEVLERIYIGRRFRNDTERLEKLFEMYTKMTTKVSA